MDPSSERVYVFLRFERGSARDSLFLEGQGIFLRPRARGLGRLPRRVEQELLHLGFLRVRARGALRAGLGPRVPGARPLYGDEGCPNLRIERPSFSARYVHEGMTLALKGTLFFEMGGGPSSSSWEGWFRYAGLSLSVDRELAEEEDAFLPRVASSLEQAGMPDSSRQAAR